MKDSGGAGRARSTRPWVLLTAFGLGGAACQEGVSLSTLRARIEVDPPAGTTLGFDTHVLGVTERAEPQVVRIRNIGTGVLELEASLAGPGRDQARVSFVPARLNPGASGELFVRFEPTTTGTVTPDLVLRSNDARDLELVWPLLGYARDPCRLKAEPRFQVFALGEERRVRVTAASRHRCVLTAIETDTSMFNLVDPPALPYVLPAGGHLDLTVVHDGGTLQPGVPIRQMWMQESEGTQATVSFEGEPPLYGCLEIGPDRITLPTTPIDEVALARVVVRNRCAEPASLTDASIGVGYHAYTVLRPTVYPVAVPALETVSIDIEYRPVLTTGDYGRINVRTNDARLPRKSIDIYGDAAPSIIEVFPRTIDFGTVAYRNPQGDTQRSECASSGRLVRIYSTGRSPVELRGLSLSEGWDDLFQIASVTLDGAPIDYTQPFLIPSGSELLVSLVFYPTRAAPPAHEGRLRLEHNVDEGVTEVVLLGRGGRDGATLDQFEQLPGPKSDILWVIDDSCSMFDEQARLISNLGQFVGYADGLDADYQMAVVTTDAFSENAGRFERCFPHPSIVGSSYADSTTRDAAFRCMFDVGTNGSGIEAGLGAAKRALERALDPFLPQNGNAGFVRSDAQLSIVVVSDEDDLSNEPDAVLEQYFRSVKGRLGGGDRVKLHAIAFPVEEDCESGSRFGTPGYRYSGMSRRLNGRFFNICRPDWQPILRDLGIDTFTPIDEWELSRQADPATLLVTVDGAPARQSGEEGWTFDPIANSIRFHGTAVPEPGSTIEVAYQGLCRP